MKKSAFALLSVLLFSGCMFNMPTPSEQITGTYTSGLRYTDYNCPILSIEFDSLIRREKQLVIAQDQRMNTSQLQAFFTGYGLGDGIEASELANIRGEKEALLTAIRKKGCEDLQFNPTSNVLISDEKNYPYSGDKKSFRARLRPPPDPEYH